MKKMNTNSFRKAIIAKTSINQIGLGEEHKFLNDTWRFESSCFVDDGHQEMVTK
jgi:hypothetical protein